MDILRPKIVKIGNRCYRKHVANTELIDKNFNEEDEEFLKSIKSKKPNEDYDIYNDESCSLDRKNECNDDNNEDDDYNRIDSLQNGFFKLEIPIASAYYGYIIGKNGEQKKRLEIDTNATIQIPSIRKQNEDDNNSIITIKSKSKSNIISCKNRIELIVSSARQKQMFTHMLLYPLNFDLLKSSFNEFKIKVMKYCSNDRGIDESIFQNPNKFHLTIGTLVLLNNKEKNDAVNLLEECKRTFIKTTINIEPLQIHLKGLEYMNDDPSAVDVLYSKIKSIGDIDRLQMISDRVVKKFLNTGLMKRQFDKVKLHATVMNTLRRNDDINPTNITIDKERESFDARNVLKLFGDFDFGIYTIDRLDIAIRYTVASDGYYECIGNIKFQTEF